ncbi:MAG: type IV pilus secretin PilQ [Thermodesulfobacteriota bacterium]
MYISDRRLRHALFGLLVAGGLAFTGCASTGPREVNGPGPDAKAQAEESAAASQRVSVEYINVVGDGDRVLIGTTGAVKYTVFKLTDPSRIIVDMPGVDLDRVDSTISVDNDFLKDITAVSYGEEKEIGRLIIGLKEGIDHDVKAGENSILVSLHGMTADAAAEDAPGSVVMASTVVEEDLTDASSETAPVAPAAAQASVEAPAEPVAEAAPAEPVQVAKAEVPATAVAEAAAEAAPITEAVEPLAQAKRILGVERSSEGVNTVIRIKTDGLIGNFNSFSLDDPARIVVDIWTIDNGTGRDVIRVKDGFIKAIRIGAHPDKTRLVLDAAGESLPAHTVARDVDTIVVTIGPEAVAASVKEPAPGPNTVYASKAAELGVAHVPAPAAVSAKDEPAPVEQATVTEPAPVEEPAPAPDVSKAAMEPAPVEDAPVTESVPAAPAEQVSMTEPVPAEEPVAAPATATPAPEVNKADVETAPVEQRTERVLSVDYKKVDDTGRLTIVTSGPVPYTVNDSPDGKTVLIDLKGAVIPEELHRTLDASKLKTSVKTISSYQQRTIPDKAVRVLVKLKSKASYAVNESAGVIQVDFASPVEAPVEAAAATEAGPQKMSKSDVEGVYTGKKIDIDMMDANVRDVLRLLAEISNLNIIASDDVTGSISLRLKGVPWDQAFDIILKSKGLDSIMEGNVIRVAPAARIRRERESHLASRKAQQKLEDLEIEFVPVNYAKATDLVKQIQDVLTERGTVNSDVRTNTLIIKDVKDAIASAVNLVKRLDTPIPQVLIEARIVEATSSFARDLGIQWGVDYQTGGKVSTNTFGGTTTSGQTLTGTTTTPVFGAATGAENFAVNLPATGTAGTLGALGFILGSAGSNPLVLDLRLSAGESEGRLKTISRPRITTMDNKEAKIEQGESIPFETTSASGTATTFIDANLSLTVTPHITPDGSVLMKIKASRNSIGTFTTSSGEPSINKKEASTEVLVRDGETTVIGGIVITDKSDTEKGIPWLKDIPGLGWFFKNRSISDSQTELLIFITPTIIKDKITG